MYKYLLAILICFSAITQLLAQNNHSHFYTDFDKDTFIYDDGYKHITIPPHYYHCKNIWQVGKPHKKVLDSAYSKPNAMVTDTVNSYPPNDTSVFIFTLENNFWTLPSELQGYYFVNTDSLKAYGTIDFSPDTGKTWYNIFTDTAIQKYLTWTDKPVLTGNSNGWKHFFLDIDYHFGKGVCHLNRYEITMWRFSFISDSTKSNKDGLMFDNMGFDNYAEGINEIYYNDSLSKAIPNPAHDAIDIVLTKNGIEPFDLQVIDGAGRVLFTEYHIMNGKYHLSTRSFTRGIYYYTVTNANGHLRSGGRFEVE